MANNLHDIVKENADKFGIKLSSGISFSLKDWTLKPTPYLKLTVLKKSAFDIGLFINTLNEAGLSLGYEIKAGKNKTALIIDANAGTDISKDINFLKPDIKFSLGIRFKI